VGPWSRSFVSAVAGRAERPSDAALAELHDLTVEVGLIRAQVGECTVTLTADPVPTRIWEAMTRFARGRGPLEEAVAGRIQSVHLEHLMAEDWEEPLIPRSRSITRGCSCDAADTCEHIVALTFAFTDRVEDDPSVLLRWRGCLEKPLAGQRGALTVKEPPRKIEPWRGGSLPVSSAMRSLPAGAVLQRLGTSEVRVGEADLADVLRRAYAVLAPR
jgi:uncharacterized Zn finger protein